MKFIQTTTISTLTLGLFGVKSSLNFMKSVVVNRLCQ
jgi:hypothetical protein